VILPKELARTLPRSRLLTEPEWRGIGVQQSRGWQHYALHRYVEYINVSCKACVILFLRFLKYFLANVICLFSSHVYNILFGFMDIFLCSPEPHILLFRRQLGTDPQTGRIDPELAAQALMEYKDQPGLRANAIA
jgi:Cyclin-dependent kinase regulatory subunit